MSPMTRRAWSRFLSITTPFFTSEKRWWAWGGLVLLLAFVLSLNGLNITSSYVGRDFMSAVAERQADRYYHFFLLYLVVFAASTVVTVFYEFTKDRLALLWRQWLTQHFVDRYLAHQAYCRILRRKEIDNPDQRISQDVKTFTAWTLMFGLTLLNSPITILAFAGVL